MPANLIEAASIIKTLPVNIVRTQFRVICYLTINQEKTCVNFPLIKVLEGLVKNRLVILLSLQ